MTPETMSKEDLCTEFERATKEAIQESGLVTVEEARDIVAKRVQKADETTPSAGDDSTDGESGQSDEEGRITREELKDRLPEDIWNAVREHIDASDVAKILDTEQVDSYLAKQHKGLAGVHGEQVEAAERRQQAAAESVDPSTPVLDQTVYDGEEGV